MSRCLKTVWCVHFSFGKGDVFVVQNEMEDGWLWVTSERTKESGLVPAPFVKDLVCVDVGVGKGGESRGVQMGCGFGGSEWGGERGQWTGSNPLCQGPGNGMCNVGGESGGVQVRVGCRFGV